MINTRFVLIVERGVLEQFAILCVSSIRKFGGKLANAPISCYSPRKQFYPGLKTIEALKKLDVEIILQKLNYLKTMNGTIKCNFEIPDLMFPIELTTNNIDKLLKDYKSRNQMSEAAKSMFI